MREAEVAVSETAMEAMGVDELLSLTRDAGLRIVEELVCRGNGAVLQIDVSERIDEERLSILDCVDGWNHVVERDSSHLYVISFTAPKLPESLEETSTGLIGSCDPEIDDSDATLSLVGSHDAISGQLSGFDEGGVSPTLQRISGYEGQRLPLMNYPPASEKLFKQPGTWDFTRYLRKPLPMILQPN